ncbi:MAG: hypothetical protein ACK55I_38030, partial [bacterium]
MGGQPRTREPECRGVDRRQTADLGGRPGTLLDLKGLGVGCLHVASLDHCSDSTGVGSAGAAAGSRPFIIGCSYACEIGRRLFTGINGSSAALASSGGRSS